jgi:type IV secretory pathway TrbD component
MTPWAGETPGFEAPIHRAVWERILSAGAPRVWSSVWLVLCLYGVLLVFVTKQVWWLVPLALGWVVGQGVLVVLTQWDVQWDELLLAQLTRRYKRLYEAG